MKRSVTLLALAILTAPAAYAQESDGRPTITPDDYGQWERLGRGTLPA